MAEYIESPEFKTNYLELMDKERRTKKKVIITKRSKPVAQLMSIGEEDKSVFGIMQGSVQIVGDILTPLDETWDASH